MSVPEAVHGEVPCGIEYAVLPLPDRRVVSFEIRMIAGLCEEPADRLGLARIVEDTITKGTERRGAQELSDAFDALGAVRGSGVGRETTTFSCTVLPEYLDDCVALYAEFLRTPTFPPEMIDVCVDLTRQEHLALEDDPHDLWEKFIAVRAYGPILGRHALGEPEALERINRDDVTAYWQRVYGAGRMQVSVAGPVEPARMADLFESRFSGFGAPGRADCEPYDAQFHPGTEHHAKTLEQEHLGMCFPGVYVTDPDYATQRVMLGVLSGGMSGRLFTEVREKQGLVYWVSAWHETPRGVGRVFLGASTTPQRCDRTYDALFKEVERLGEDLRPDELERAVTGIEARMKTSGSTTRAMCHELANDLFYRGAPMPRAEKLARVHAVTVDDVGAYLARHPRDRLCVVTLGPRELEARH